MLCLDCHASKLGFRKMKKELCCTPASFYKGQSLYRFRKKKIKLFLFILFLARVPVPPSLLFSLVSFISLVSSVASLVSPLFSPSGNERTSLSRPASANHRASAVKFVKVG